MFLSPCLCRVGFEVALLGVVFEQDATGGKCRDQTRKRAHPFAAFNTTYRWATGEQTFSANFSEVSSRLVEAPLSYRVYMKARFAKL